MSTFESKTYWEEVSESRWGRYISKIEYNALLKAHRALDNPTHALEIGAEGGRWSKILTDLGLQLTCTDISRQSVQICQSRLPNANCILVNQNDKTLPVENSSQDLVLCIEVPPVIQSDWFIPELKRVLKPGGVVIGVWWNKHSLRGLIAHSTVKIRGEHDYYQKGYVSFKRTLRASAFKVIDEVGFSWFPFSRISNNFLIPVVTKLEQLMWLQKMPLLSPWVVFVARFENDDSDSSSGTTNR